MNYTLTNLPNSGKNPIVFMEISIDGQSIGKIYIKLFRDAFPAGVENFVRIAEGHTYKNIAKTSCKFTYTKKIRRTYDACKFFNLLHNNYIIGGDIYRNDGRDAGTIYSDEAIPANFGDYYFSHTKGMVSLIPYYVDGVKYYDSTFMIILSDSKCSDTIRELDNDQIVIGQVYSGLDILDKINILIKPYAGRKYPIVVINEAGIHKTNQQLRRIQIQ